MRLSAGEESQRVRRSKAAKPRLPELASRKQLVLLNRRNDGVRMHSSDRASCHANWELTGMAIVASRAELEKTLAKSSGSRPSKEINTTDPDNSGKKKRPNQATRAVSGIPSLFDAHLFLNVVAAGLAAAVAALVSRASGPSNDLAQQTLMRYEPQKGGAHAAKSPTLASKARRKARVRQCPLPASEIRVYQQSRGKRLLRHEREERSCSSWSQA